MRIYQELRRGIESSSTCSRAGLFRYLPEVCRRCWLPLTARGTQEQKGRFQDHARVPEEGVLEALAASREGLGVCTELSVLLIYVCSFYFEKCLMWTIF